MQVKLLSLGSLSRLACSVLLLQTAFFTVSPSEADSGFGSGYFSDSSGSGSGFGRSDGKISSGSPSTNGSGPGSVYGLMCVVL